MCFVLSDTTNSEITCCYIWPNITSQKSWKSQKKIWWLMGTIDDRHDHFKPSKGFWWQTWSMVNGLNSLWELWLIVMILRGGPKVWKFTLFLMNTSLLADAYCLISQIAQSKLQENKIKIFFERWLTSNCLWKMH